MSRMQTQAPPQAQEQTRQDDDFSRLMSKDARIGGMYKTLSAASHNIEAMLPDFMKGQSDRLIRRALITFSKNPDLQGITDVDFRRCVIEAAEVGFAIDGKMCYVVKYKGTYQLQLDYKAVVAVAKRCRTIKDIDADVVCANDQFKHGKFGGQSVLEHTFTLSQPRGEVTGAYCRVFLPDGTWNYEVMTREQLDSVQKRAPAQNGPWRTDPDEMRKKTVIRRKLKLYQDDPGLMRMLEITAWEDEPAEPPQAATISELTAQLKARGAALPPRNGNGHGHPPMARGEIPLDTPDEPTDPETHDRPQTTEEVDEDLIKLAVMDFGVATDDMGVDYSRDELLKRDMNEATLAAIVGMAKDRKAALASVEKKTSGKK